MHFVEFIEPSSSFLSYKQAQRLSHWMIAGKHYAFQLAATGSSSLRPVIVRNSHFPGRAARVTAPDLRV